MYGHTEYNGFIIYKKQTECDCVPACVVSILNSHGESYDLKKAIDFAWEKEYMEPLFSIRKERRGGMNPARIPFFIKHLTDGKYRATLKTDPITSLECDREVMNRLASEKMLELVSNYVFEILSNEEMPLIVGLGDHAVVLLEINDTVVYGNPDGGLIIKSNKKNFKKDFDHFSVKIKKS